MKLAAVILFAGLACGQKFEFEVASIKPHPPGDSSSSTRAIPGGLIATNVSLRVLILQAFDIQDFQLVGGPNWINDDHWDINARDLNFVMPDDPSNLTQQQRDVLTQQYRERLRNLVIDRFQLVFHREPREQSIYALVIGKNGAKLPPPRTGTPNSSTDTNFSNGKMTATYTGATMAMLAQTLSRGGGRPVLDKTGISGQYDFKLEWAVDLAAGAPDTGSPSVFTAVQEQLGLRLESQKAPLDTIVIDRVQKASDN